MSGALNNLISTLYQTAQDNSAWVAVSDQLRAFTGASKSVFAVRKWSDREILNAHQHGFEEKAFGVYEDYFFTVDVWTAGLARMPMSRFYAQHQFIGDRDFTNSEIYTDFAHQNDIRYLSGCIADIPGTGLFGQLSAIRDHNGTEFSDNMLASLNLLAPHFQQALLLGQKIQSLETGLVSLERIVDRMPECVFVLSADRKVLYRNAAAETLLSLSDLIQAPNGHLSLAGSDSMNRLPMLVKSACGAAAGEARAGGDAFRVENDTHALDIMVLPFRFRRDGEVGHMDRPCALAIVNDTAKGVALNERSLKALYNMTRTEAAVTNLLARGLSPLEIADERAVSLDTVRAQIRSIHQKTDCSNQTQLLSKILSGVSRFS